MRVYATNICDVDGSRVVSLDTIAYFVKVEELVSGSVGEDHIVVTGVIPSFGLELRLQLFYTPCLGTCRTVYEYTFNLSHIIIFSVYIIPVIASAARSIPRMPARRS